MNAASTSSKTATTKTVGTNAKTGQPMFQIALVQHSGLVLTWFTAEYTLTGSYRDRLAALDVAQRHNRLAGWWSPASLLRPNRAALAANTAAGKTLAREAARAFGHPSARPVGAETKEPVAA